MKIHIDIVKYYRDGRRYVCFYDATKRNKNYLVIQSNIKHLYLSKEVVASDPEPPKDAFFRDSFITRRYFCSEKK